jgi:hypothetical protein
VIRRAIASHDVWEVASRLRLWRIRHPWLAALIAAFVDGACCSVGAPKPSRELVLTIGLRREVVEGREGELARRAVAG